jgi:hypothetical protein
MRQVSHICIIDEEQQDFSSESDSDGGTTKKPRKQKLIKRIDTPANKQTKKKEIKLADTKPAKRKAISK